MMKNLCVVFVCLLLAGSAFAQKTKPWGDWSKKDADKILNDSAWGQSQTKGESPAGLPQGANAGNANRNANAGANSVTIPTEYYMRVRLISAKPIREGVARRIQLAQPDKASEMAGPLQNIIDKGFGDFIIIALNAEGVDPRTGAMVMQGFSRLNTAALNGKAYLERKDGKRLELIEYQAPVGDNLGGKFLFPRTLDGAPFLSPDSGTLRFVLNGSDKMKVDTKFKVADMMYGEKLEY